MDVIQFEVKFERPPDELSSILALEASINGIVAVPWTHFSLDLLALHDSTHQAGEHFIWTCGCGVPGCAGIYHGIVVAHTASAVVWQVPKVPFASAARFEFDRPAYVATVNQALAEYFRYFQSYRAARIPFDSVPDHQLSDLIALMAKF